MQILVSHAQQTPRVLQCVRVDVRQTVQSLVVKKSNLNANVHEIPWDRELADGLDERYGPPTRYDSYHMSRDNKL